MNFVGAFEHDMDILVAFQRNVITKLWVSGLHNCECLQLYVCIAFISVPLQSDHNLGVAVFAGCPLSRD